MSHNTAFHAISQHSISRPRSIAIRSEPVLINYAQLERLSVTMGGYLRNKGIRKGDAVLVLLPRGIEMALTSFSVMRYAVCVPLNPESTEAEISSLIEQVHPQMIITHPASAAHFKLSLDIPISEIDLNHESRSWVFMDEKAVEPNELTDSTFPEPSDRALMLLTSGSTSTPKLVPLSHANLSSSIANLIDSLDLSSADRALNMMTMFHVGGLIDLLLAPLTIGSEVQCPDRPDSKTFFKYLREFQPTWYQCVPTMLCDMLDALEMGIEELPEDNSLRFIRSVSSPLSEELAKKAEKLLRVPVVEIYGMTETAGVIASNPLPPEEKKLNSVGRQIGDTQIKIIDKQNNPLQAEEVGEVIVSGPQVFSGYHNNEIQNKELFIADWFRTGDTGLLDDEGYLFLKGRVKDIINRGGEKISPQEIDQVLQSHPEVSEAAAFSIPHPTLGEEVAAAVVLEERSQISAEELHDFTGKNLSAFKQPRVIRFTDRIPRNSGGKLQRHLLTQNYKDCLAESMKIEDGPSTELEKDIAKLWMSMLKVKGVNRQDDFFSLGGDSLRALLFIDELERSTGRRIDPKIIYEYPILEELGRYLEDQEKPSAIHAKNSKEDLHEELKRLMSLWPGSRLHEDALIVGRNTLGSKVPIYWCTNSLDHFEGLVRHLDPDQPFYGLVTLMESEYRSMENNRRAAEIYAKEIIQLHPGQEIIISAWCEGAKIVIDMANEVRQAGLMVKLLFIQDNFIPKAYDGPTAFFFTKLGMARYRDQYHDPDFGMSKYFTGGFTTIFHEIEHTDFYEDQACIQEFAKKMPSMIEESIRTIENSTATKTTVSKQILARTACQARLVLKSPLLAIRHGDARAFEVEVENTSNTSWSPSAESGIVLMVSWLDLAYRTELKQGFKIPRKLDPGEKTTLTISVDTPEIKKNLKILFLRVDLVDDGVARFSSYGSKAVRFPTLSSPLMLYPVILTRANTIIHKLEDLIWYKRLEQRSLPIIITNQFVRLLRWGRDLTYPITE